MQKNIYVSQPYLPNVDKYKSYIDFIYQNNYLTNNGPLVRELEKRLADFLGLKNIILVSNGTLALQTSFKALGLTGNVITTPFSFVATTSALSWEGLESNFVDIDKNTLNINPALIERDINKNTSAILATHVFGNPCDLDEIDRISKHHNLKIIYDGAHAFDVRYNEKSIFNYGDISIISFHATKLFHTIEGGAIITNDDEMDQKIRKMINFGIDKQGDITEIGINCKMNEFQAAMGLTVLDEIDIISLKRKEIAEYYDKNLSSKFCRQIISKQATKNYSYYPILCESEEILKEILQNLNDENIYPRRYFYPSLNELEYVKYKKMPVSEDISRRVLCLPIYPGLEKKVLDLIIKIMNDDLG